MNTQGVSYATARNDLFHLEEIGHLKKQKSGKEFLFVLIRNDA
ncbi:hypothetical protein [Methanococcoides alaskense]|uniref:Fic family protein n=1 Tax=Methanococcoides alaskense TaxID=325778 RepID=A0AA90TYC3_9EURY|nr:hypothetical protein [Methanococcoides alaskense]MDR6222190.1 Fic family protein [Methanococcoides alaskense]